MIYLLIYFALFAVWITAELLLAPKGFEDNHGFHYGNPKDDRSKHYNSRKEHRKVRSEKREKIRL